MNIKSIHLHLELKDSYLDDSEKVLLRRYGESQTGDSISRDILIPSDMPLHNLHYAIQKLFGWRNSHLRQFILPKETYDRLTGGTAKGWLDLVGDLFQPPSEYEHDVFWDDDYEKGSIDRWLKRKYTGSYKYGGRLEIYEAAKKDARALIDRFPMVEVRESFNSYLERSKKTDATDVKVLRKAPLIDLTLEEMHDSIMFEGGSESLLERLEVSAVLADKNESISADSLFPVTNELIYNYDYGDGWEITVTREDKFTHLIEDGFVTLAEISEASDTVMNEYRPVCIHREGVCVMDDVGGLSGFADFLGQLYESEDKDISRQCRAWAKSQGWSDKKVGINKML